jgi:hypothetical protein
MGSWMILRISTSRALSAMGLAACIIGEKIANRRSVGIIFEYIA